MIYLWLYINFQQDKKKIAQLEKVLYDDKKFIADSLNIPEYKRRSTTSASLNSGRASSAVSFVKLAQTKMWNFLDRPNSSVGAKVGKDPRYTYVII